MSKTFKSCQVFNKNGEAEYAVFYPEESENPDQETGKTMDEIVEEIRKGRALRHEKSSSTEIKPKSELKLLFKDINGNKDREEQIEKIFTQEYDIIIFTECNSLGFDYWMKVTGSSYSFVLQPPFNESTGGIVILYRNINVINSGRLFTWRHLNQDSEGGLLYPGVEGNFIDVSSNGTITRFIALYHFRHSHRNPRVECRVNVTNFIEKISTKEIPPNNSQPAHVHLFGRFHFEADTKFSQLLKARNERLEIQQIGDDDEFILTTEKRSFLECDQSDDGYQCVVNVAI